MAKKQELEEKKKKNKKEEIKDKKTTTKKKSVEKEVKKVSKTVKNEKSKELKKEVKEEVKESVILPLEENANNAKKTKIIKGIIYSLICFLLIGAFIYSIIESNDRLKYFKTITFDEVDELMNDDEVNIIYWASPSCGYCVQFTPIVKEVSYQEKITFNYLNTANLSNDQYATMITYFGEYNEDYNSKGVGTPSIILVEDGKVVDIQVGALEKEGLLSYLTSKGFVE